MGTKTHATRTASRSASRVARPAGNGVGSEATAWPAVALLGMVLVAYAPVYRAGFIWDDDDYVIENATLRDAAGLWRIWTDPAATPQYYPLVHTTFWLEYQTWGLWPPGFHVTNVFLHALNAILLWRILTRLALPPPVAWLAAALFAVHPVHVESVAWITERKNVLSAAFGLAALLPACRFFGLDGPDPRPATNAGRDWRLYAAASALFIAALLSKTVLCSLPVVIWLLIWWRRGRVRPFEIVVLLPWLAVGATFGLLTAWLERTQLGATGGVFALTIPERVMIAGRAAWFYWLKLLWPHPLVFMYPRWDPATLTAVDFVPPLGVVLVVAGLMASRSRIGRGPLAAVLAFLVTVFPALGFVNIYPMRFTFVADHYQYLASAGPLVLAGWVIWRLADRTGADVRSAQVAPSAAWPFGCAAAAVLVVLGGLTVWQATIYHDLESLWTATLAGNPRCAAAMFHLGKVRMQQGRHAEAAALFAASRRFDVDEAEADISETLEGNALVRAGRPDEAVPLFEAALARNPDNVEALNSLANQHARRGEPSKALPLYRRALVQRPNDPAILMNLGNAISFAGDDTAAIAAYGAAVAIRPADPTLLVNLAAALARVGRFDEAVVHLTTARRVDPANDQALGLLERIEADRRRRPVP